MRKFLLTALFAIPALSFSQVLLQEDFESGSLPSTWTVQQLNTSETWGVIEGTSSYVASVNYDAALEQQDEWLITPTLDLSTPMTYTFSGEIGLSYYWAVDPENNYDVFIKISTDGGTTWTQLWSENELGVFTNWTLNPVTLDLSSYSGNANVKLAFQYVGLDGAALYVDNVKVQSSPPPTSAPTCAVLSSPANGATGISASGTTLTWMPSADATSYDVYMDTNMNPTTLVGNKTGTSYNASNLALNTTYYWKITPKNMLGSASGCTVNSFTTSAIPEYCGPIVFEWFFGDGDEPITLVDFAGINNSTNTEPYVGDSHEFFLDQTANVTQGESYDIKLEGNTGGNYENFFAVFIDWNQNGVLTDDGEVYAVTQTITDSDGTDGQQALHSITVPADALPGTTRMRIKKTDDSEDVLDPCLGGSFGQVEDYNVNVATLAVSDVSKTSIKAYPNPVVDVLNIESASKVKSVSIFDASGKNAANFELNAAKSQVNLSRLAPGVYLVKVVTENGSNTVKVIKK